jgi:hypothetical protein
MAEGWLGVAKVFMTFYENFLCHYGDKKFLRALSGNMICEFCLRE